MANTERVIVIEDKKENLNLDNRPFTVRQDRQDRQDLEPVISDQIKEGPKDEKSLRTLAMSVYNPLLLDNNGGDAVDKGPDVWVHKWVDYSSK